MKLKKPYIGVTGFMSRAEVDAVLTAIPAGAERLLMVGVLVSSKSIVGIPNSNPNRYPRPEKIADMFTNHPKVLNFAHIHIKDTDKLLDFMCKVAEFGGENFHGFQLNIPWPSIYALMEYRRSNPDHKIVLQCGRQALERVNVDPYILAKKVSEYVGVCDYVLIDQSMGEGKLLNPAFVMECLDAMSYLKEEFRFVIAGGLRSGGLDIIKPIMAEYPDISFDTEKGVRDDNDNLVVAKAKQFYLEGYEISTRNKNEFQ